MSSAVKSVENSDEYVAAVSKAGDKLVVVDFYATWCGPCKIIAPKLEEMANKLPDIVFLKVDVDEVEDVAADLGVEAMPTFKFLKNGKVVATVVGADISKIQAEVDKHK